jgi:hypothetical protein
MVENVYKVVLGEQQAKVMERNVKSVGRSSRFD